MKLSRRHMLALAGAGGMLRKGMPQTPSAAQPAPPPANPDPVAAAREQHRRGAENLSKVDLPITTEPAFLFRA